MVALCVVFTLWEQTGAPAVDSVDRGVVGGNQILRDIPLNHQLLPSPVLSSYLHSYENDTKQ